MSAIPPPDRPRHNVALIVSICVNLLLAGVIAMAVFRFAFRPPLPVVMGGPGGQPGGIGHMERQQIRLLLTPRGLMHIVPEKRDSIRAVLQPHRARMDTLRNESTAARADVLRLYAAPTLDKGALDKAFARMLAADAAMEAELVKMASEVSVLLSPEERSQVLEWQSHGHGFHGGGRRGGHGPHGDDPPPTPDGQ